MTDILNQQTIRAHVDDVVLDVVDARVTHDDTWAPSWQADLGIRNAGDVADLDPLGSTPVTLELIQRFGDLAVTADLTEMFGGGTTADVTAAWGGLTTGDVSTLPGREWNSAPIDGTGCTVTLWLRRVAPTHSGTTRLYLESAEQLLRDAMWPDFAGQPATILTPTPRSIRELFTKVKTEFEAQGGSLPIEIIPGGVDGYELPLVLNTDMNAWVLEWQPRTGQSLWDYLEPFLTINDVWLHGDLTGNLALDRSSPTDLEEVTAPDYYLVRPVLDYDLQTDRADDRYGDAVIAEYLPREGEPAIPYVFTAPDDAPFTKPIYLKYDQVTPASSWAEFSVAFLDSIVDRAERRARSVSVELLSDFNIRAHDKVGFEYFKDNDRGWIQSIEWSLPEARMRVELRDLDTNSLVFPIGD